MKQLVRVPLRFSQTNKHQNIIVHAYYVLVDKLIYKPVKFQIISGTLSNLHEDNKSKDREKDRIEKSQLLKTNFKKVGTNTFELVDVKTYEDAKGIGTISFIKKLTGSNQNRFSPLYIKTDIEDYMGLNVARLFQDPNLYKPKKGENPLDWEVISFERFVYENDEYAFMLLDNYAENIETCTTTKVVVTSNKNGQEKLQKEILSELKYSENQGVNTNAQIMGVFKRNLLALMPKKCVICGIEHQNLLVASHIKARSESDDIEEKIAGNNGLWLCAQHDRAFDRRLFTFSDNGELIISHQLAKENIFDDLNYHLPKEILERSRIFLNFHNGKFNEKFANHSL